jgi:hypothetical protein
MAAGGVEQKVIEDRRVRRSTAADEFRAGAPVRKREEPEAVRQFVRRDGNEINIGVVIIVQAEIEMNPRQTAGITKIYVESHPDFDRCGVQIASKLRIGERRRIPGAEDFGAGEIPPGAKRAPASKFGRIRGAAQRVPGYQRRNGRDAIESGAPLVGGGLDSNHPLLSERCADIAADREDRRRVIETDARGVAILDDDG